jgi:predicted nucleic acid-binding protein
MLTKPGERRLANSRPTYVLDATSIIHFAKIEKLRLVLGICEAYITREVYREVVERGKERPDAIVIHDAIEHGELRIYDVHDTRSVRAFQRHPEIHLGEAETLAAAKELNALAVVDEAEARAIAKTYGVQTRMGTLYLLFKLISLKRIDPMECLKILDELVESGLYIDSHTLLKARQRIGEKLTRQGC